MVFRANSSPLSLSLEGAQALVRFPIIDPLFRIFHPALFSLVRRGESVIYLKAFEHVFAIFTVRDIDVRRPAATLAS